MTMDSIKGSMTAMPLALPLSITVSRQTHDIFAKCRLSPIFLLFVMDR
jgi:hypothetical protein